MPIKVEDSVPHDLRQRYPWKTMKVGDSFFLNYIEDRKLIARRVRGAMTYASKKFGTKYSMKTTLSGVRVWRVE